MFVLSRESSASHTLDAWELPGELILKSVSFCSSLSLDLLNMNLGVTGKYRHFNKLPESKYGTSGPHTQRNTDQTLVNNYNLYKAVDSRYI